MPPNTSRTLIEIMHNWSQIHLVQVLLILFAAWLANVLLQRFLPALVRRIRPHTRFFLLPWVLSLRLLIFVTAAMWVTPLLIKPTTENLLALIGAVALTTGFAFKDYVSCLLAGIVFLFERPYRVGDCVQTLRHGLSNSFWLVMLKIRCHRRCVGKPTIKHRDLEMRINR